MSAKSCPGGQLISFKHRHNHEEDFKLDYYLIIDWENHTYNWLSVPMLTDPQFHQCDSADGRNNFFVIVSMMKGT